MREAKIKIKNYAEDISIIDNQINLRSKFFYFIIISFAIFAFFYLLILGNMVSNIIERKTVELETRELSTEVADLESSYSLLINNIDKESSLALGFKEINPTFTNRTSLGFSLKDNYTKLVKNEI